MAESETTLLLAPQLKAMLDGEAYHYCADCHTHCRQTILAVEAAKEATKAHASDAEQLVDLRKLAQTSLDLLTDIYRSHASQRFSAVRLSPICAHVRELQTLLNIKKSDRCPHGIYRRLVKCALCDQFEVNTNAD